VTDYYPIPGYLRTEDLSNAPTLMTDGCPTEYPSWYYVALPVDHPDARVYPNNMTSYCKGTEAHVALKLYKELIKAGLPVLGIVRVSEHGGAVEVRNENGKTNGTAHHNEDFGSW
jgi:hypothetical protein